MILKNVIQDDPLILALAIGEVRKPWHDISSNKLGIPIGAIIHILINGSPYWIDIGTSSSHIYIELRLFTPVWHVVGQSNSFSYGFRYEHGPSYICIHFLAVCIVEYHIDLVSEQPQIRLEQTMIKIDGNLELDIIFSPVEDADFKVRLLIRPIVIIRVKVERKIDDLVFLVKNDDGEVLIVKEVPWQ
jgi:hypothetical protein